MSGPKAEHADEATLRRICAYFLRLGALGFGGPWRWWATCSAIWSPIGAGSASMSIGMGWLSRRWRPALWPLNWPCGWPSSARASEARRWSFAFVGPPFLITVTLAAIYVAAGGATWLAALFYGIAPAAIPSSSSPRIDCCR